MGPLLQLKLSKKTYIGSIQCEGHLPIHLDSDTLAYGKWFHKVHSCHKDCAQCMGPGIDFLCKLYCQDSQCHVDIHLFGLEMRNILSKGSLFWLG